MVTFFPEIVITSKLLILVNANVVVPANVTTEFCFSLVRLILLFVGAEISCKTISVQAATAGAICAKSVQTHAAAEDEEVVADEEEVVADGEVVTGTDEEITVEEVVDVDEVDCAVTTQEQAEETLLGESEQPPR